MNDDLIGRRVGGYEIIEVLGKGGMATVYRAHQLSMNRSVALKILPRHFLNDDTYMQRFEREVQIVSQLEHRGIVPVYDYGEDDGQPYIVMRLMSGGSIDDLLQQQRDTPLSLDRILALIEPIAPALDYAHSKGVLHRDLKPSNVLLDESGGVYLTDFGIARLAGDSHGTITTQGVVGTPAYMSPEQAQGKPLDGRSDLYSLGVMLFEMATGRRPFDGDTPYGIAVHHVMTTPPMPRSINPALPAAVEAVILKTLNKLPDARYPNTTAFAEALRQALQPMLTSGTSTHDTQPRTPLEAGGDGYDGAHADVTQPTTPSGAEHNTVAAYGLPYATPLPYSAAPLTPPPTGAPTGGTSSGYAPLRPRRQRRSPNLLLSALAGGGIGCALLLFILVVTLILIALLQRDGTLASTSTPNSRIVADGTSEVTADTAATPVPSLEPTFTRDSGSLIGSGTAAAALPEGQIVFTSERGETGFDLYRLDLTRTETGTRASPTAAPYPETRLTSDPGDEIAPALSPDGRRIAFASDRDGDFEIYVLELAGGDWRPITDNAYTDRAPAWSPDGEWLVFSSDVRGDGNHDLRRAHPDGSGLETLYGDGLRNTDPSWASDGFFLFFTGGLATDPTTWEIKRLTLETDVVTPMTTNSTRDAQPAFTPDGSILYASEGEGYSAITRITATGDQSILYDGLGYDAGAFPSPNGRWIVFNSDITGRDELYALPVGNVSQIRALTSNGGLGAQWGPSP